MCSGKTYGLTLERSLTKKKTKQNCSFPLRLKHTTRTKSGHLFAKYEKTPNLSLWSYSGFVHTKPRNTFALKGEVLTPGLPGKSLNMLSK